MDLDEHFAGHEGSRDVFEAVRAAIDAIGPARMQVTKSQVSFARRRRFAWAWVPDRYLRGGHAPLVVSFALSRPHPSPRIKEVVEPAPGRFMHHVELWAPSDVDRDVTELLAGAWDEAG